MLPGMQSAFVDIGLDSDAFLYVGDFLENLEDYDHVVAPVEGKVEKMEQQGGEVFAPPANGGASEQGTSSQDLSRSAESAPLEPASAESSSQAEVSGNVAFSRPPVRETPRPPVPFARQERRPGGFGQGRHDQGRRGGRGGRWRQGRGGQGQGHRYQGRDLPPSRNTLRRAPYSRRRVASRLGSLVRNCRPELRANHSAGRGP